MCVTYGQVTRYLLPLSVSLFRVCLSVCLSVRVVVTTVSPAKTAEPIEKPFELQTRAGPNNRLLVEVHNGRHLQNTFE